MSLLAYPAYANPSTLPTAPESDYAAAYPNAACVLPRALAFAGGSSLAADHLEYPQAQRPPRLGYFHARGTGCTQLGAPSTGYDHGLGGTSLSASSAPALGTASVMGTGTAAYATGVPISGYSAFATAGRGRAWSRDGASADEVQGQGRTVHGHASAATLPTNALRYPASAAAAAASRRAPSPGPSNSMAPSSSSRSGIGSGAYKNAGEGGVVLASPTPQLALPPQMAILLNNGSLRHDGDHTDSYGAAPDPYDAGRVNSDNRLRMPVAYAVLYPDISEPAGADDPDDALEEGFLSREKKHGCTMCHKRFDRPSTLKKARRHLLVHTGEKGTRLTSPTSTAFQCAICERRFGVLSNLNRHIRRCALREVHSHGSASSTALPAGAAPSSSATSANANATALSTLAAAAGTFSAATSASARPAAASANADADANPNPPPRPRKRRRRPPSPSRWVPPSLRAFTLLAPDEAPPAPVPLPPVSPGRGARGAYRSAFSYSDMAYDDAASECDSDALPWPEERDSWDENVGRAPYHPREWVKTRRLPGPRPGVRFGGNWNFK
ncbi:hypothetical protein FB451DRAFT_1466820 [Mycena latifolia]|nr:hypothetical protein FB451DRAFT_1466820 [Mycena latifolia]